MTLLTLEFFFVLCGLLLAAVGVRTACDASHPTRWGSALFWVVLAVVFAAGKQLPPVLVGYLVVGLVLLAALGRTGPTARADRAQAEREVSADRLGNRLLVPVLAVPAVAIVGGVVLGEIHWDELALVEARSVSQVALGLGCLFGLGGALRVTRETPVAAVDEGGRLLQLIGWALVLPQLLAALGGIFARAGVGEVVAQLVASALPIQVPLVAVLAYGAGMVLFTVLLGNAFAAFPIMTLGVGLPFIVNAHGGNPAIMGALGMLSGYCGTLITPMAANFNLVPVRLLELRDDFAVIRAQAPFAAAIWVFNMATMALCVYRF